MMTLPKTAASMESFAENGLYCDPMILADTTESLEKGSDDDRQNDHQRH